MLMKHTTNANACAHDTIHKRIGIVRNYELASTRDLATSPDLRISLESLSSQPNLSEHLVGCQLTEVSVEVLDCQQVAPSARGPLKPLSCRHVLRAVLPQQRKPLPNYASLRSFPTGNPRV